MPLSEEIILTFLLEHGGKVKNSELVRKFKGFLSSSDPAERKHNRELFKRLVNGVAVVLQAEDGKYVAVKKKYLRCKTDATTSSCLIQANSGDLDHVNNNYSLQEGNNTESGCIHPILPEETTCVTKSVTARVLSVASDPKTGKTGSVFALVAIKSPQGAPQKGRSLSEDVKLPPPVVKALKAKATTNLRCGDGFLYRSLRARRKDPESCSLQLRRSFKVSKCGSEAKDTIPLGAMEHEWLVQSASGSWRQICGLLLQDPKLAAKPNFMSGFTILHWAAKSGNGEMVCKVMDASRRSGSWVNVNAKSHDGYTALHIAAIHAREHVLLLLVCEFGASTNVRDNSGKKPYHYLNQDASTEIRQILGDPSCRKQEALGYLKDEESLLKGFSKLFQTHAAAQKNKNIRRMSFHSTRGDEEQRKSST